MRFYSASWYGSNKCVIDLIPGVQEYKYFSFISTKCLWIAEYSPYSYLALLNLHCHPPGHTYLQRIMYLQEYLESQSQTIRIIGLHSLQSSEKDHKTPTLSYSHHPPSRLSPPTMRISWSRVLLSPRFSRNLVLPAGC